MEVEHLDRAIISPCCKYWLGGMKGTSANRTIMIIVILVNQCLEFVIPYLDGTIVVTGEDPGTSGMKGNALDTIALLIKFDDETVGVRLAD